MHNRFPFWRNDNSVGIKSAGAIPNITGLLDCNGTYGFDIFNTASGAFALQTRQLWRSDTVQYTTAQGNTRFSQATFDASRVKSVYSSVSSVYAIYQSIGGYIIKY